MTMDNEQWGKLLDDESWRLFPHTYAERLSKGKWKPYDYLRFISIRIAQGIYKGNARFIIEAPPRHGKSELISHWLPVWFLDLWPEKNVILSTYASIFASHWGRIVRNEIQENDDIDIAIREDSSAANRWDTVQGGGMLTAGIGGPILGRGGDLLLLDDPVKNWEEATSSVNRERNKQWFKTTFYTRKEPNASIVLLMQRWHEDDLAGWLQKEHEDNWVTIKLPAIAEVDDIMKRKEGEALCPDRYDEEDLKGIEKGVGPMVWSFLFQQRPTALGGGIIKRKYIRHYSELPTNKPLIWGQTWDMAFKETETSSFVVGQVWAKCGADRYLVDQFRERTDFNGTVEALRNLTKNYPQARLKLVEGKANGPAVINKLKSEISGLIEYNPKGSKIARLSAVSPDFASGNIYVPIKEHHPWVKDWIEELVNMPNAPNDDQADATSQILEYWGDFKIPVVKPVSATRTAPIAI